MSFFSKKIITLLVLASFLLVASFGFVVMAHRADGSMPGDCPISAESLSSLCALGTLDMVIYHISAYNSFMSAPINYGLLAVILLTIVFASLLTFLSRYLRSILSFGTREISLFDFNLGGFLYNRRFNSWLSLLEHSPSQ